MNVTFDVKGVQIEFPYEPYECQKKFIEKVILALTDKANAILESPTGTGKTLSLLCSTLAYLKTQKETYSLSTSQVATAGLPNAPNVSALSVRLFPQVIYASRTHSQLRQVIRELNKTNYKSAIKVCVLAGRDQLCLHQKVQKESNSSAKSQICRALVHSQKCTFYNELKNTDSTIVRDMYSKEMAGNAMDIEDLVKAGKKFRHCPFYHMRNEQQGADLILLPYNYILDPKVRETYNINLRGNILIFDEAHNLGNIAEESISMSISSATMAMCIQETKNVVEAITSAVEEIREEAENQAIPLHLLESDKSKKKEKNLTADDVVLLLRSFYQIYKNLSDILQKLEDVLDEFWKSPPDSNSRVDSAPGRVYHGSVLIKILAEAGITVDNSLQIGLIIDRMGMYMMKREIDEGQSLSGIFSPKISKLSDFSSFVSRVFGLGSSGRNLDVYGFFRLYVTNTDESDAASYTLNYWCFSPHIAMRNLMDKGPISILLASGTLSPIQNFIRSMGLTFTHVLENGHAAKSDQVLVRPLREGPDKTELYGTFQNRDSKTYLSAIGDVIMGVASNCPQGMLVFFPSYSQMSKFISEWKIPSKGSLCHWAAFQRLKTLCVEPKKSSEVSLTFREFDMAVREGKGAIMFAVCRGKMSEGIDFADCHCRAVVVVGIPYPPLFEARIVLKKKFLADRAAKFKDEMSSDEWYQIQAIRAVNQALGRIIRHKDDFGVVVLADARYGTLPINQYPAWIRPSFRPHSDAERLFSEIRRFFSERSLLVEKSQDSYSLNMNSGSSGSHSRTFVGTDTIDNRSNDERQFDEFLKTAKGYGFDFCGDEGSQNQSKASHSQATSTLNVIPTSSVSLSKPARIVNTVTQKRKLNLVRRSAAPANPTEAKRPK